MDELDKLLKRIAKKSEVSKQEQLRRRNKQRIKEKKKPLVERYSPAEKPEDIAAFKKRVKELKGGRLNEYRNCQHPHHLGSRRIHERDGFSRTTSYCAVCHAIEKYKQKTIKYLKKVAMARDKLLDAITKGQLGEGTLREFYSLALTEFGGLQGLVQCIRAEFDAAEDGSQLRKQYLEMVVKVMVALSTMGQEDQVEQLSDEEIAKRVHAERKKAAQLLDTEE